MATAALGAGREELARRLAAVRTAAERDAPSSPPTWPTLPVVVDEVAELTCRDLGDDWATRAAQQAAEGWLCEIARLRRSVAVNLVCCTQRPDAEAVPGQLKARLSSTVTFRVRAAVNGYILLDCARAALLPPFPGRAICQEVQTEELRAVDCSLEESRELLSPRWSARSPHPPQGPGTQWWENTGPSFDLTSEPSMWESRGY